MRSAGFRLDPGFAAAYARSDDARELLEDPVDRVAARARELAPDDPATSGDDLKGMIEGEVIMEDGRWIGRVASNNFKGNWKEFGSSREAAQPYLRPALEAEVGPVEG